MKKYLFVSLLLSSVVYAGIISHTDYTSGTTITAAAQNANENAIVNEFNGNIDSNNIKTSGVATANITDASITAAKLATPLTVSSMTITAFNSSTATITHIVGTATNDNATVGTYGEYISSYTASTAAGGSTIQVNLVQVLLTPGDWELTATALASGVVSNYDVCLNTTNGSGGSCTVADNEVTTNVSGSFAVVIPNYRASLTSNTTYYLKGAVTHSSSPTWSAKLTARRMR